MRFRNWWVTQTIRCSSRIFVHKERFLSAHGGRFISEALLIVGNEILLILLGLPLFLVTGAGILDVAPSSSFRVRRLAAILIMLILSGIWLVKAVFVTYKEFMIANGGIFSVTTMIAPPRETSLVRPSVDPLPLLVPPRILGTDQSEVFLTRIAGDAPALARVTVFIDDPVGRRTLSVFTTAGNDGLWSLALGDSPLALGTVPPGRYVLSAIAEIPGTRYVSVPSQPLPIVIEATATERFVATAGTLLATATVVMGALALLITLLVTS